MNLVPFDLWHRVHQFFVCNIEGDQARELYMELRPTWDSYGNKIREYEIARRNYGRRSTDVLELAGDRLERREHDHHDMRPLREGRHPADESDSGGVHRPAAGRMDYRSDNAGRIASSDSLLREKLCDKLGNPHEAGTGRKEDNQAWRSGVQSTTLIEFLHAMNILDDPCACWEVGEALWGQGNRQQLSQAAGKIMRDLEEEGLVKKTRHRYRQRWSITKWGRNHLHESKAKG